MYQTKFFFLLVWLVLCQFSSAQSQTISINTENTSLIMSVTKNKLYHHYYGHRIANISEYTQLINYKHESYRYEAFPVFGGNYIEEPAMRVTHSDGNLSLCLHVQDVQKNEIDNNRTETSIKFKDAYYPFYVSLTFVAYHKQDIIESSISLYHEENGPVNIHTVASFFMQFNKRKNYLTQFHGDWGNEMIMKEHLLTEGVKILDSKQGVRTTRTQNPSFIISFDQPACEDMGEVMMGHIAWSGNWNLLFQLTHEGRLNMLGGINPFASQYSLKKGEIFETPKAILTYSSEGTGKASRNFHSWAREFAIPEGTRIRPVLLNNWEGTHFNFDQQKIASIIDGAKELGVEMFVLDDAWFGNKYPRNDEKNGLGDWEVNKSKLPGGIKFLTDKCKSNKLKFGIWVEPEMVNPNSELFLKHPEWVIQQPHRTIEQSRWQYVLDLTNLKVQEYIFSIIDNLLIQNPDIYYIKWDANRHIMNAGTSNLPSELQEHIWIDYTRGFYRILDRIKQKYPRVIFQSCASGGGRVEYGALKYFHEFWASDNTDAYQRIFMQWGLSYFFPAITIASHVTSVPNQQTQRITPIKFRFDVAMSGRLGVEMQPDHMTVDEKAFAKQAIQNYYEIRDVVQTGDLYRLRSPFENNVASLMYVSENKDKAVFFAWQMNRTVGMNPEPIRLKGLNSEASYKITEINTFTTKPKSFIASGDFLMTAGFIITTSKWASDVANTISFTADFDSEVYRIEQIK
jgi:alpha-galactosidase